MRPKIVHPSELVSSKHAADRSAKAFLIYTTVRPQRTTGFRPLLTDECALGGDPENSVQIELPQPLEPIPRHQLGGCFAFLGPSTPEWRPILHIFQEYDRLERPRRGVVGLPKPNLEAVLKPHGGSPHHSSCQPMLQSYRDKSLLMNDVVDLAAKLFELSGSVSAASTIFVDVT